ncbi:ABC transporter substrate-binding protein [Mesorhizobium sp. CAU 1741]|uniref:ABC transporter substrate-binding protein n=1 Tax=Mesorhizobium sp. CAU 1741 TaxID=3140366 RepID=UPI00325B3702
MLRELTRRAALALAAAGFSTMVVGASSAAALEATDVKIGISINDSTFLPLYLAEEEGYFSDEGLNVEVVVFRGGSDLTRALVAEAVNIAIAAPTSVLSAITAGQDLKVFFGGFNHTPFYWYAVPPIASVEDAKGKRFAITRFGSSTDALTRYMLTNAGLDPDADVQIVQGGNSPERLTAMETGQIDATITSYPFNFLAEERGYNLIASQRDAMPDFPIQSVYAAQSYIDGHPETIKAMLRGLIRGMKLAKSDKERAIKALVDRVGLDERYAQMAYDDLITGWNEDGLLASEEGLKAFFDMAIAVGDAAEPWPLERFWDDRFVSTIDEWRDAQ